ncbi:MAG TPA: hypothetical protein ENI15_18815 [Spirochaetes bacterium]|nr:hypothetical protein [Spirochaetota bacterium]
MLIPSGLFNNDSIGLAEHQEATAVGAISSLMKSDYITSTHRGHGHCVSKGLFALYQMNEDELNKFIESAKTNLFDTDQYDNLLDAAVDYHLFRTMAELIGKEEGYCRGRGGGMHIADFSVGNMGANAIVGGSFGIATGAAFTIAHYGQEKIILCCVGDGSMNNGIAHEAMNFATMAQFKKGLPVVYFVENNQYGYTGQQKGEVTGIELLAKRGCAYNDVSMHAESICGMNVLSVREAVRRARELCIKGEGPVLIEANEIDSNYKTKQILRNPRKYPRNNEGKILARHAVTEALIEEMMRDKRVVLWGEDISEHGGAFSATLGLYDIFGAQRIFNTAISEAAIIGTGVGAAMTGLRPVVEIMFIDFILQAMDQVGNQAAKARFMFGGQYSIPLTIRTTIGGGKGYAGQHSQSLESVLTHFPGLKVVIPSNAYDMKGLLKTAIRDDNPVIFIEHQWVYLEKAVVPEREEYLIPFGEARVVKEGGDITVVAYSHMVSRATMFLPPWPRLSKWNVCLL